MKQRPELAGIDKETLTALVRDWGEPEYRARQILHWRNQGVLEPEQMSNLPRSLKHALSKQLQCSSLKLMARQVSRDGTRKYLFSLLRTGLPGKLIESVFIPEPRRGTVCLSSQVGCVLDCPFCHTGTQAFETNLSASEIVAQVLAIKADLRTEPPSKDLHNKITHIVYMGMGEPLANEAAVHKSLAFLLSEEGLNLSRRRITVSTSGLLPQIRRLGERYPVNLAISLHAARNELRDVLVPINRKYPLEQLRACLDAYPLGPQRHLTLEYVMLEGVNDTQADLDALSRFVNPARERINLIRFNPYPGNPYTGSDPERMDAFARGLISRGIRATVRRSRGQDIMAACGQLKAASAKAHRRTEVQ